MPDVGVTDHENEGQPAKGSTHDLLIPLRRLSQMSQEELLLNKDAKRLHKAVTRFGDDR